MFEAARVGDDIGHSGALAGMIAGTIVGGLIAAAGAFWRGDVYCRSRRILPWRGCAARRRKRPWGITPGSWRPPPGTVSPTPGHPV